MSCSQGCCNSDIEHWRSIAVSRSFIADRKLDRELGLYRQARAEGSQPFGTKTEQSAEALRESDRLGRPFRADDLAETYYPQLNKCIRELTATEKAEARKAFSDGTSGE